MSSLRAVRLLLALGLVSAGLHATVGAQAPASANARLLALYTEEWAWQQREFRWRGDQPDWPGRAIATLDTIQSPHCRPTNR